MIGLKLWEYAAGDDLFAAVREVTVATYGEVLVDRSGVLETFLDGLRGRMQTLGPRRPRRVPDTFLATPSQGPRNPAGRCGLFMLVAWRGRPECRAEPPGKPTPGKPTGDDRCRRPDDTEGESAS
jgi:hypothetical protein